MKENDYYGHYKAFVNELKHNPGQTLQIYCRYLSPHASRGDRYTQRWHQRSRCRSSEALPVLGVPQLPIGVMRS